MKYARPFEMLTVAFGESTISRTQVQLWYNRFKEGREDVRDDARPGRPSTLTTDKNIEAVKQMLLNNRRTTIREVGDDVGQVIFTDVLGVKRMAAKIVPKLLNFKQKHGHRSGDVDDDPNLLKKVRTGDKASVYGSSIETKAQSST